MRARVPVGQRVAGQQPRRVVGGRLVDVARHALQQAQVVVIVADPRPVAAGDAAQAAHQVVVVAQRVAAAARLLGHGRAQPVGVGGVRPARLVVAGDVEAVGGLLRLAGLVVEEGLGLPLPAVDVDDGLHQVGWRVAVGDGRAARVGHPLEVAGRVVGQDAGQAAVVDLLDHPAQLVVAALPEVAGRVAADHPVALLVVAELADPVLRVLALHQPG